MLHPDVQVQVSPIDGFGLIAAQEISSGTAVWVLDGSELYLSLEDVLKLPLHQRHLLYYCKGFYVLCFDGSQYMNHCCDPNTGWLDDETMIATRDIEYGEELTYDYATSEIDADFRPSWRCKCGTYNCRGIITAADCLDADFQMRHEGLIPSWTLEYIWQHNAIYFPSS